MKELIYRRELGGYQARNAVGISQVNRHRGTQYSTTCMDDKDDKVFCYRQLRMDDGTLAIGAGYLDPLLQDAKRKSYMAHLLYAQAGEVSALLDSYPSSSAYFARFKEAFKQNEQLHSQPAEMEIPLQIYLLQTKGGLESAPAILRKAFQTQESLSAVFEALLDAASKNTRMLVIFGQEEDPMELAESGRRIIEALFACLPQVVVRYLGYISPAVEDKDNSLFCVRYSRPRPIGGGMRPHTYTFDIASQAIVVPTNANHAAKEYADELAELVFRGDASAFARIRTLKKQLNDESLYDVKDLPKDLALRYRFYNGPQNISNSDIRDLLNWHNDTIDAAEKGETDLDKSILWGVLDRWIIGELLHHIHSVSNSWKDTDPVFSIRRVREIYAAGQRLYKLGRKEAAAYQQYFDGRLGSEPMVDDASEKSVAAELVKYVTQQVKIATDSDIASRALYWNSIERWLRDNWCSGKLLGDRAALEAVNLIYELDKNLGAPYMDAYARYCLHENISLLEVTRTSFGKTVYQQLLKKNASYVVESMQRDLDKKAPYIERAALDRFLVYRDLVAGNADLQNAYLKICDRCQKDMLSRINRDTVEKVVAELNSSDQEGMIGAFYRMDPKRNVRDLIEKRIVEVTRDTGVYPYYPANPQLAADVASLLDRCLNNDLWSKRLKKLKQANSLSLVGLDDEQFHQLMEDDFGSHNDRPLSQKCKALLWENIKRTFGENASDIKSLLMALALHNNSDGYFVPRGIMKDLESFDVNPKKVLGYCKKQAKPNVFQGLAYVAAAVLDYDSGKLDRRGDDSVVYPGMLRKAEPGKKRGASSAGLFAGVPAFVAVLMVVVGTSGLAASIFGLLNFTGLI